MISVKVEKITPKIATDYLKQNTNNYRRLNRRVVERYANDMKSGLWEMNGEAIVFDENGLLKNGQHRLAAIAVSGVTVETLVVRGVSEDVSAYDLNSVRNATQISNAQGVAVSKEILAAVNLMFLLGGNGSRTPMKIVEYCGKHEADLNRSWRCLLNGKNTKFIKRGSIVLAAHMMLTLGVMPFYEVEVFFKVFSSNDDFGTDGYEVSPALVARKMFDERWKGPSCLRTQREQLDVIVQAMNDLHENKKRTNNYKIASPFSYEPLIKRMIAMEG